MSKRRRAWPFVLMLAGTLVTFSLAIDHAGEVRRATVIGKVEQISVTRRQWWRRSLTLKLDYGTDEMAGATNAIACDAATFDSLRVGDSVAVRALQLWGPFRLVRLKERSTWSIFRSWLPRTPRGPWQQSTADVREITHITKIRLRNRHNSGERNIAAQWPYDIVQLSFVPSGRMEAVTAVEVIESASLPGLQKGASVAIRWPQDNPRAAQIIGARAGSRWANVDFHIGTSIAVVLAMLGALEVLRRWRQKRVAARAQMPLPG